MSKQTFWVVLPASGIGSRMDSDCPKQYMPFAGSTVIESTLKVLLDFDRVEGAIVVLSKNDSYWSKLNFQHNKNVYTVTGANERSGSVFNGLKKLADVTDTDNLMVMIHDAVRPCINNADLSLLVKQCEQGMKAVFLAHPVTDTIKQADKNLCAITTINRESLWRAFTPQVFSYDLILKAHEYVAKNNVDITDDVSAVEQIGISSKIVQGRPDNIKITYPHDLLIAQTILENLNT